MSMSLVLKIKPSRVLRNLLFFMNALVFISFSWSLFSIHYLKSSFIYWILFTSLYIVLCNLQYRYWKKLVFIQLKIDQGGNISLFNLGVEEQCENSTLKLLPDSVCWSFLLMLRFQMYDGKLLNVPVLLDSVDSSDEFRRLSVAINWAIRRGNSHQDQQDITNGNF